MATIWFLQYDSAPEHPAKIIKHFVVKGDKKEICHLLYSAECAPANLFICPEVKNVHKGRWIQDIEDIKKSVAIKWNAIHFDVPDECFMWL